jgi:hypothetical protein
MFRTCQIVWKRILLRKIDLAMEDCDVQHCLEKALVLDVKVIAGFCVAGGRQPASTETWSGCHAREMPLACF